MKRRIVSLLVCLLLLGSLSATAFAATPYIVDEAGLLTASEEAQLENECRAFREANNMDIAIVTVNSLGGKTAMAYADDYFDAHYGPNGLLLLISMGEREWHITTTGTANEAFQDSDLAAMENGFLDYLSDGFYNEAFTWFLSDAAYYVSDVPPSPLVSSLVGAAPIGAIIALVIVLFMRLSMNTKRPQRSAGNYLNQGSYNLKTCQDLFLYSNVSKVRRQQSSSSSGSSTHRSSSGASHGGRGGKF